jgi:hypothetical protein
MSTGNVTTNAPMNTATAIKEKILRIEAALLEGNPQLPLLLREIHTAIRDDHETVTILSEEEISILVRGLMKQTATVISAEALAKGTKKALKNMSTDDI